ncbi:hypothetical protein ACN2WE_30110 [Streptomyces sp. cg28]|uniref:hypothetical protein n=1 Tax=Streptomyces sp. cg28 TaxID=3403457 RepID=UPI003B21BB6A
MTLEQSSVGHSDPPRREEYDQILDTVVAPVAEAYYSQLVQAVSGARGRAQAAQSTITVFAGGLMATLSVTALTDRPRFAQILGIVAVAVWLVAAVLYLRAVASPVPEPWDRKVVTRQQLLNAVIEKVRDEAQMIDRRQRQANVVAAVAAALSLTAFALAVVQAPVRDTSEGAIVVAPSYTPVLRALCSAGAASTGLIEGEITKGSLTTPFVEIKPVDGICTKQSTVLQVPRGKVTAVRWRDA